MNDLLLSISYISIFSQSLNYQKKLMVLHLSTLHLWRMETEKKI